MFERPATAMAILPFLGAGQTPIDGSYKATVKGGITYLTTRIKDNGSMHERGGRLYNTSLATMILEVYYRHPRIYEKKTATEE